MTSDPINPYSTSPVQELTPVHEAYKLASSQEPVTVTLHKYAFCQEVFPDLVHKGERCTCFDTPKPKEEITTTDTTEL